MWHGCVVLQLVSAAGFSDFRRCAPSPTGRPPTAACICARAHEEIFASTEGLADLCAARALELAGSRLPVFHVSAGSASASPHCIVDLCSGSGCADGEDAWWPQVPQSGDDTSTAWRSYAPEEMCPAGGQPAILAEVSPAVGREAEMAEFVGMFGPAKLRPEQELRSLRRECGDRHRLVAEVCLPGAEGGCDDWSKYSLPRCHVFLGLPYDPTHASFLYAPACERAGQFYCPASVPIALRVTLKAGSRSAVLWAAMLEGLLPGIVAMRRTLAAALPEMPSEGSCGRLADYLRDFLEHDELRLGCSAESAMYSMHMAVHLLASQAQVGLPFGLCPTCCTTGAGRLRVVMLRRPLARLWSYYRGYWAPQKGHLLAGGFSEWVARILGETRTGYNRTLFEADDLDHVQPALSEPLTRGRAVAFSIEALSASERALAHALCQPPFGYCSPLPAFPAWGLPANGRGEPPELLRAELQAQVAERYRYDLAALDDLESAER